MSLKQKMKDTNRRIRSPSHKEAIKQRNIVIILIPLIVIALLFLSIYTMKDVSMRFIVNKGIELNSESDDNYLRIELITEHNGVEYSFTPSDEFQKLPKDSTLKGIKITSNETDMATYDSIDYSYSKNFTFIAEQNISDTLEFEKGHLFNYDSEINYRNYWRWQFPFFFQHIYVCEKIFYYSFEFVNDTYDIIYKNINDLFINFTFFTNRSLNGESGIYLYNFFTEGWEKLSNSTIEGNTIIEREIPYPFVFLNQSRTNGTDIHFKVVTSTLNVGSYADYSYNIDFNTNSTFWNEVDNYFYYEEISQFSYNESISLLNTLNIKENTYTFTSVVNVTITIGFGSWIMYRTNILQNSIIISEKIQYFSFLENINLKIDSALGLRLMELTINDYDLSTHKIDYSLAFTELALY